MELPSYDDLYKVDNGTVVPREPEPQGGPQPPMEPPYEATYVYPPYVAASPPPPEPPVPHNYPCCNARGGAWVAMVMPLVLQVVLGIWCFYGTETSGLIVGIVVFPILYMLSVYGCIGLASRLELDDGRCNCSEAIALIVLCMLFFCCPPAIVTGVFAPVYRGVTMADAQFVGPVPSALTPQSLGQATHAQYFHFDRPRVVTANAGRFDKRLRSKAGYYTATTYAAPIVDGAAANATGASIWGCVCGPQGCRQFPAFNFTMGAGVRAWSRPWCTDGVRVRSKIYLGYCQYAARAAIARNPNSTLFANMPPVRNLVFVEVTEFPRVAPVIFRIIVIVAGTLSGTGILFAIFFAFLI